MPVSATKISETIAVGVSICRVITRFKAPQGKVGTRIKADSDRREGTERLDVDHVCTAVKTLDSLSQHHIYSST